MNIALCFLYKGGQFMSTHLTKQVLQYQSMCMNNPKRNRKESYRLFRLIENQCLLILYQYPVKTHFLREEDASELLLSIKPRLPKIIASFTFTGIPFEHYIQRIAYMQAQVLLKQHRRKLMREMNVSIPYETFVEFIASDNFVGYGTHADVNQTSSSEWVSTSHACLVLKQRINKSKSFRRKFLQLVLLCSNSLNAHHISFLAGYLEMDEFELAKIMHIAREQSVERCRKIEQLKKIRDGHFYDSIQYQREYVMLKNNFAPQEKIERLLERCERERLLCYQRNSQIQKRTNPITHEVVARLTHVPKGTVDSGVVSLKRYLREIMDGCG